MTEVFLVGSLPGTTVDELKQEFPGCRITVWDRQGPLQSDAERIVVYGRIPDGIEPARVDWLHTPWTGVERAVERFAGTKTLLTNSKGAQAKAMSEYILGACFLFGRSFPGWIANQRRTAWDKSWRPTQRLLCDSTILLVGLGSIGERAAKLCRRVGMRVLGIRNRPERGCPDCERVEGPEALDSLLPEADYLALSVPSTKETTRLLDEKRIGLLRETAVVINVGRGTAIDEAALARALRANRLRGACLDVFSPEPLPPDSPLWKLEHCIVTPHVSAFPLTRPEQRLELFRRNLRRFLDGKTDEMESRVDPERGY